MTRPCHCSGNPSDAVLTFGEDGEIEPGADTPSSRFPPLVTPCPIGALNGSWLLEVVPTSPFSPQVRGPMRIQVGASSLRVSGDIYTHRGIPLPGDRGEPPLLPDPPPIVGGGDVGSRAAEAADEAAHADLVPVLPPWYPSFPKGQYAWYFRSTGVTYGGGTLTVTFVRHLWNQATQEFVTTDRGTLVLTCRQSLFPVPFHPQTMQGELRVGGTVSPVRASKTSTFYRGCRVEVDAMVNRAFPASATIGSGAIATFRSIYAAAGWDVTVVTDEIDVPADASLTNAELATLLTTHREPVPGERWRLWLFVGSTQGSLFGIMFDDDAVPREGAAGFADATLSNDPVIAASARNRPLNDVPAAFLRTLVHEAGHAFNLFHPKHDVHLPGIGIEIMNQTGDVIGFATVANPYPNNAAFVFSEHDRISLVHSPDPQVRPGWKNFGWGHGSLSAGLPAPVDVGGLATSDGDVPLVLTVRMPAQAFVGEYVTAEVQLTNTGVAPRQVTGLLTLAEGDLVFLRTSPNGDLDHVLDVTVGCGPRPLVTLQPGESVTNHVQVFFTNQGVTFLDPGRHTVVARLAVDAVATVQSDPVTIDIRTPASADEGAISSRTLTPGVGRAFALGDFAADDSVRAVLVDLAEQHTDSDTGAAGALVLANSFARTFTDFRADRVRAVASDEARHFVDLAVRGRSARRVLELAVTVASPTEKDAPVVKDTLEAVRQTRSTGTRTAAASGELAEAEGIASDFANVQAR